MAGIGFEIERLLRQKTASATVKAYLASAVISAGPWLFTILTLGFLLFAPPSNVALPELELFRSTVIYVFAFSLVTVGSIQFALTRALSDRLFAGEEKALLPAFCTSLLPVAAVHAGTAAAAAWWAGTPVPYGIILCALYSFVGLIWHAMIFLSAVKDYGAIVRGFGIGSAVSLVAAWGLGYYEGLTGYLAGFAFGQGVLWGILTVRIGIEFRSDRLFDPTLPAALWKYPLLIGAGLFYHLGIWIDKMVFWFGAPDRTQVLFFRSYPPYDSALFAAYLFTVPAFALFLVKAETAFHREFVSFFQGILRRTGYSAVREQRNELVDSALAGFGTIVRVQGGVTLLCILFAETIAGWFRLPPEGVAIFRIGSLAAYLHVLFMVLLVYVFYLDLRGSALVLSVLFCVSNGLLTAATIRLGEPFYGYGYAAASLLSLGGAYVLLARGFERLPYRTFTSQPVGGLELKE